MISIKRMRPCVFCVCARVCLCVCARARVFVCVRVCKISSCWVKLRRRDKRLEAAMCKKIVKKCNDGCEKIKAKENGSRWRKTKTPGIEEKRSRSHRRPHYNAWLHERHDRSAGNYRFDESRRLWYGPSSHRSMRLRQGEANG